jgi:pimeloyl-ACP methyl ester carboxylesterase
VPDNSSLAKSAEGYTALVAWYEATLKRLTGTYESLTVETRFGKTHLIAAGPDHAPPVVILHGAASNAVGCWPLINGLAPTYRIYAPDAPRQLGITEPFRLSPRGADYGKWLVDILDALNVAQADFVGFSFGGWMTLKLAAFAPQRVARVVLLSPVGVVQFRLQYLMRAPIFLLGLLIRPTEAALHRFARFITGPTASNAVVEEFAEAGQVFFKNFKMQAVPLRLSKRDLQRLDAPTLLLMGQHDVFCRPETVVSRLQEHLPDAQATIIADAGHAICFERPELVNGRILEFLRETV